MSSAASSGASSLPRLRPIPPDEQVDNPPPFKAKLGGYSKPPWHDDSDPVSGWEPEFRALAAALDRGRALGEWGLAFAHLRAGARRTLAFLRAEQYADFAAVLEDLSKPNWTRDELDLLVSTFRERARTTDSDHAGRILDVTFRSVAAAEKQRHPRWPSDAAHELLDPPTRAETLWAARCLRGMWVHAPESCAEAGAAGATEALVRTLANGVPPPPRDSPADMLQGALDRWVREEGDKKKARGGEGGGETDEKRAEATGEDGSSRPARGPGPGGGPPVKIAFPDGWEAASEGFEETGFPSSMSIGWDVDDPVATFGQPSEDDVRCEILEALLALLSGSAPCRAEFVRSLGGVRLVAEFLVPWLAEGGGEEAPSELVQRCIVFLGVLVKHILPDGSSEEVTRDAASALAAEAEATLTETIGAEAAAEILEAAEELNSEEGAGAGADAGGAGDESEDDASGGARSRDGNEAPGGSSSRRSSGGGAAWRRRSSGGSSGASGEGRRAAPEERDAAGEEPRAPSGEEPRAPSGEELLAGALGAMRVAGLDPDGRLAGLAADIAANRDAADEGEGEK